MARHECGEMRRAAFLLAFVQHADPKRELTHRGAVGVDRLEARHQIALVVRNTAAVEKAVAFGRLEGWRRPLVERIRRLHVVMVVNKKSAIAATGLALAACGSTGSGGAGRITSAAPDRKSVGEGDG